jgi:hypothetical protein
VIHFYAGSRQIRLREMTREEREQMGPAQRKKEAASSSE